MKIFADNKIDLQKFSKDFFKKGGTLLNDVQQLKTDLQNQVTINEDQKKEIERLLEALKKAANKQEQLENNINSLEQQDKKKNKKTNKNSNSKVNQENNRLKNRNRELGAKISEQDLRIGQLTTQLSKQKKLEDEIERLRNEVAKMSTKQELATTKKQN